MTTRADLDLLNQATTQAVRFAVDELEQLWVRVRTSSPEVIRDAFLELLPSLVDKYGNVAGSAAAEWYEYVRAGQVRGRYAAAVAAGLDTDAVQGSVRYAAGHLFGETPDKTIAVLSGTVQRHVAGAARRTVLANVDRDPANPRWARIPRGRVTCAFCSMLASRGFVYGTEDTAGERDEYHDYCDCKPVPDWSDDPLIEGYHPERFLSMYEDAVASVGNRQQTHKIVARLRDLYPDDLTDGHVHPDQ